MIIRINLHPQKKVQTKTNPATGVLAVCIILMIVIVAGFFLAASDLDTQTRQKKAQSNQVQNEIAAIQARIGDLASIRAKIADLNNRQIVLARLASIRQGPQYVLNELSRLLTNPHDKIKQKEMTEKGWTVAWDPESVILRTFKDIGNSEIELTGTARTMEDIYEFWTRMKTSTMLRNIELVEFKDSKDSITGDVTQNFVFTAEANFNYQTKAGQELVKSLTQEESDKPADQVAE